MGLDEKASLTRAQEKIDSKLLRAIKRKRGERDGLPAEPLSFDTDAKGRVLLDITARVSPRLLSKIKRLGGEVISSSERYHTIRARLALNKLEALAADAAVRFVAPAAEPMTDGGAVTN